MDFSLARERTAALQRVLNPTAPSLRPFACGSHVPNDIPWLLYDQAQGPPANVFPGVSNTPDTGPFMRRAHPAVQGGGYHANDYGKPRQSSGQQVPQSPRSRQQPDPGHDPAQETAQAQQLEILAPPHGQGCLLPVLEPLLIPPRALLEAVATRQRRQSRSRSSAASRSTQSSRSTKQARSAQAAQPSWPSHPPGPSRPSLLAAWRSELSPTAEPFHPPRTLRMPHAAGPSGLSPTAEPFHLPETPRTPHQPGPSRPSHLTAQLPRRPRTPSPSHPAGPSSPAGLPQPVLHPAAWLPRSPHLASLFRPPPAA
ncbi:hypothetical protein VTI74DRAFT_6170 [Chaetomium olivicolor]